MQAESPAPLARPVHEGDTSRAGGEDTVEKNGEGRKPSQDLGLMPGKKKARKKKEIRGDSKGQTQAESTATSSKYEVQRVERQSVSSTERFHSSNSEHKPAASENRSEASEHRSVAREHSSVASESESRSSRHSMQASLPRLASLSSSFGSGKETEQSRHKQESAKLSNEQPVVSPRPSPGIESKKTDRQASPRDSGSLRGDTEAMHESISGRG